MPLISTQLYSARERLAEDRDAVLRRLAAIGLTAVEPFNLLDDPAGLRAQLDGVGLSVPTAHGWGLDGPDAEKIMAAAKTLGTERLIVSSLPEENFADAAGLERAAEVLRRVTATAAGFGLRIGYHNHWWELENRIDGEHALERLAALVPDVFLEVDTYWAAVGGADVPALLGRLGARVEALHIKDGPLVKGEPNVVLGTGAMDVPAVLAAAPHALPIIEFDSCATDVLDAIEASYGWLSKALADRDGAAGDDQGDSEGGDR